MSLHDLQRRFYGLVTAPEGVARTLAERGVPPGELETLVVADARLSAVERLDVYANMYFFRLLDVLGDDYAKVAAAVGDAAFHNLITGYLVACPPAHPSIAQAGARLPGFLADHALTRERPWLPALATLERAHTELFDGPDAEPLALDAMKTLPPDQIMALVLRPIPCHRILEHSFAIAALWDEPDRGSAAASPETLLVWRQDVEVYHRPLDEEERQLLPFFDGRATLQAICERLPAHSVELAAQRLFHVLARWLNDGLLTHQRG